MGRGRPGSGRHRDLRRRRRLCPPTATGPRRRSVGVVGFVRPADTRRVGAIVGARAGIARGRMTAETAFNRVGLARAGFEGFVTIAGLRATGTSALPSRPGVYVVLRENDSPPR